MDKNKAVEKILERIREKLGDREEARKLLTQVAEDLETSGLVWLTEDKIEFNDVVFHLGVAALVDMVAYGLSNNPDKAIEIIRKQSPEDLLITGITLALIDIIILERTRRNIPKPNVFKAEYIAALNILATTMLNTVKTRDKEFYMYLMKTAQQVKDQAELIYKRYVRRKQ